MRNLFRTFNSLLCPPLPPPTTSITADDFATFFTNKTKTISSQFSPPLTQDPQPTRSTAQTPIFSFCPLTEAEVSKLLPSYNMSSRSYPLTPSPSNLFHALTSCNVYWQEFNSTSHQKGGAAKESASL